MGQIDTDADYLIYCFEASDENSLAAAGTDVVVVVAAAGRKLDGMYLLDRLLGL